MSNLLRAGNEAAPGCKRFNKTAIWVLCFACVESSLLFLVEDMFSAYNKALRLR